MSPTGSLATLIGKAPSSGASRYGSTTTLVPSIAPSSSGTKDPDADKGPNTPANTDAKSGMAHTSAWELEKTGFYGNPHGSFGFKQVSKAGSTKSRTHLKHHELLAKQCATVLGQDSGCRELSYLVNQSKSHAAHAEQLETKKTTIRASGQSVSEKGTVEPRDERTVAKVTLEISDTNNWPELLPVVSFRAGRDKVIENAPLLDGEKIRKFIGKAWP